VFHRRCDICREFCPIHNSRKPTFEIGCISVKVINEFNFSKCLCMNIEIKELYALLYNSNIILQYQNYSVQLRSYSSGLESFRFCSYCLWQCELWYKVTECLTDHTADWGSVFDRLSEDKEVFAIPKISFRLKYLLKHDTKLLAN
jgi:hypothetical protein